MTTTASANRFSHLPITSMGFSQVPPTGGARKIGSASGASLNPDTIELDPVMKGNWMVLNPRPEASLFE